jgi:hypothetical protein
LLAVTVVGLAACSSGAGAATAATIRANLSRATRGALNGYGVPVQFDHVGCDGPSPSHDVDCRARTAFEPAGDVEGSFHVAELGGTCPGVLRITIDDVLLTAVHTDPCR